MALLFATMWKRSTKKIFSGLFYQQLDDRGLMGVELIKLLFIGEYSSLKFSDSFNSCCTMGACLKGIHMIRFIGLCVAHY